MRSASAPTATIPSARPERLGGHFQLIEQLGRGGMAVVYRALDTRTGEQLALKQAISRKNAAKDRELYALFEREFHTLAQLRHPSVIAVYDYGTDASGPFYTMELLDGGDLTDAAPLPYRRACELMMQVSCSLSLLHARGLLHRDISPRNVRYTENGSAKLIDFGAMAAMGTCAQVVGTPPFMAPEVAHRLTLDARTDLFSLGATLYYALTGQLAYPARALSELRDVWRHEPRPPSMFVPEIPPALDELVLSLIRIDPAWRPRNAFEVMQRLAAIAGVKVNETSEVSQAYLSTPIMVGREVELAQCREHILRALQGLGGGLIFEAAPGSGRTRLLDACVLEAKAVGATVLRVSSGCVEGAAFGSAHDFAAQLCEALPQVALESARNTGALDALFHKEGDAPKLAPVSEWRGERYALQVALAEWFAQVCRERPLMIAVDDAESVDEASLALLAALARVSKSLALSIVAMVPTSSDDAGALSLQVLRRQCVSHPLRPLTAQETEALFASVFANAPHVRLLSDRIFRVAAGSPRESMALAQHLLDKQLVRYADGNWRLPAELAVSDLPTSVEDALRDQLARLSPLALHLAQAQALALDGAWTRADYAEIARPRATAEVDDAISSLLRAGIVTGSGGSFMLKHRHVLQQQISQLSAAELQRRHLELANLCAQAERPALFEVHHALLAGEVERGLQRMDEVLQRHLDGSWIYVDSAVDPKSVVAILERALDDATRSGRSARILCELDRQLTSMSIPFDTDLFFRYGPAWLFYIQRDSGYDDYSAIDSAVPHADRLKLAIEKTVARYAATPDTERVYPLSEAIKYLAQYVTTGIVAGARRLDTRLLASLPGMLEPFTMLNPLLHALWQNIIAAGEMNYQAKPESARERTLEVFERLQGVQERDVPNVESIRCAIAFALGVIEVSLGYPNVEHWIETMQAHPLQKVNAMYLRRIVAIYAGDRAAAEDYRKQAEVLAVQASSRQMFDFQMMVELFAHVHARDLTGVKQTVDRIEQLAASAPGMLSQVYLAQGCYQRLRGDLQAAKEIFERCLSLVDPEIVDPPPNLNVWVNAAGGYTHVLIELGRVEQAHAFAVRAREVCLERSINMAGWGSHIERALALAEAKLGQYEKARQRLDRLIDLRSSVLPLRRSIDYEARTRVAIIERDRDATQHYAQLMTRAASNGAPTLFATYSRLADEAKHAGLELELTVSSIEGEERTSGPSLGTVASVLAGAPDRDARAQRAVSLLCEAARAAAGHLFFMRDGALTAVASIGASPDAGLTASANAFWRSELAGSDLDDLVTGALGANETEVAWASDAAGLNYRIALLKTEHADRRAYVGLAMLATDSDDLGAEYWPVSMAIATRLLAFGDVEPVCRTE